MQVNFLVWVTNLEMQSYIAQWSNCCYCRFFCTFRSIARSNCFQGANYCRGGAQLHSLLAQLIMGSQLVLESGRKTARSESHLVPLARMAPCIHQLYHWLAVEEVLRIVKKYTTLNHAVLLLSQHI